MRILHLLVARELSPGQVKQLTFEYEAARRLGDIEWSTIAYHNRESTRPFMRTIPVVFRPLLVRGLYAWIVAIRLSRKHDVVFMRHITFDPFALVFSHFVPNRISVHHAKEVEELRLIRRGWKGRAASLLERVTGRVAVRNAIAVMGVTQEIAEYERELHAPGKPTGVYPNGIDPKQVAVLDDMRASRDVHAVFLCGTFSAWHGLDKLVAAVDAHDWGTGPDGSLRIHLIGRLTDQQEQDITASDARRRVFEVHGLLDESQYRPIMARCDVGIASLAMERQNLREGSTLKVREMLAMGLAVYSGHEDIALPPSRPFVMISHAPSIAEVIAFGRSTKELSRDQIRCESLAVIDKASWMRAASTTAQQVLQTR